MAGIVKATRFDQADLLGDTEHMEAQTFSAKEGLQHEMMSCLEIGICHDMWWLTFSAKLTPGLARAAEEGPRPMAEGFPEIAQVAEAGYADIDI